MADRQRILDKPYFYIDDLFEIAICNDLGCYDDDRHWAIGNYFSSYKEAEKAREILLNTLKNLKNGI